MRVLYAHLGKLINWLSILLLSFKCTLLSFCAFMKHLPDFMTPMPFLTNVFLKHILGLLVCDPFFFPSFFPPYFSFGRGIGYDI